MKTICAITVFVLWAGVCRPVGADDNAEAGSAKPTEGPTSATAEKSAVVETYIARLGIEAEVTFFSPRNPM